MEIFASFEDEFGFSLGLDCEIIDANSVCGFYGEI
jgi:hypothetical protein